MLLAIRPETDQRVASNVGMKLSEVSELQLIVNAKLASLALNNNLTIDNRVVILRALASTMTARIGAVCGMMFLLMIANIEASAAQGASMHLVPRLGTQVKAISAANTYTSF